MADRRFKLIGKGVSSDAPSDGSSYVRKDGEWVVSTGGGVGSVTSVFARTGDVTAAVGDYSAFYSQLGHTHATTDITSGTFADARIAESNVTQHEAALTILETQITDGSLLARLAANETVSGQWTFSDYLSLTPISNPTHTEGLLWYDSGEKALSYYNDEADITLQVGRENWVRVRNTTGVTITNGSVVYVNGSAGANLPTVALAKADALATSRILGIATHDIENNTNGYVTTLGKVSDIDTSAFSAGDALFLSTSTAGGLQNTRPTTGYAVVVGYCTISNVAVGEIKVLPGVTVQQADLTAASDNETISGDWTFEGDFARNEAASTPANIDFQSAGVTRWAIRRVGTSEDFAISRYNSSGVFQENTFAINEASGTATFAAAVVMNSTFELDGDQLNLGGSNNDMLVRSGGSWGPTSNLTFSGSLLTLSGEMDITSNAPAIEQFANSNAGARRIRRVYNWDNVSAYEEIYRQVLNTAAGRAATLDWQTYNGTTYSTKIRFDGANHTIAFPSGIDDIGNDVGITGDLDVTGAISVSGSITERDSTSSLTVWGGSADGANVELYGGSHATLANRAYYDADNHTIRNQNATNTFMTMGSVSSDNIWLHEKTIAITGTAIRWQDSTNADSVEMVHDGTDFNISAINTTQIEVSGTNLALTKTGAQGDAALTIEADSDNANEASNPILQFYQDGQAIGLHMGLTGLANQDAKGNTFTGANNNSFAIHFDTYTAATDHIHIGSRGAVALTIDNNNDLLLANDLYPGGQTVGYIRAVTGSYGSIEVIGADGSSGTWSGYNIGGEAVFMSNLTGVDSTNRFGLYNDLGNRWALQYNPNADGEVVLYCNNNAGGSVTAFQTRGYDILGVTSGAQTKDHGGTYRDVGFNTLSDFNNNASDTLEAGHCGAVAFTNNTTAYTLTLAASTDLDFPVDGVTTVVNAGTSGDYTITEGTSTTLYFIDPGVGRVDTAGGCTVGPGGVATIWRQSSTVYYIWGSEITA